MAGKSDIPAGEHFIEKLARHALATQINDFPDLAYRQAELLLLDTLACAFGARDESLSRAALAVVTETGGAPRCTIIGEVQKSSAPQAVFANGVLLRVLDMNDYVPSLPGGEFGGHPSDNIPVALAAAELSCASGRDTLAAMIVGYEIYGRANALMQRGGSWDSVTVSGFAAPIMAGRLLGFDVTQLSHALSLSLARAATSAMVRVADVCAAKSLANALVAQNAMQACLLAQHGATGPMPLFEHARALQSVFPNLSALGSMLAPLDEPQVIRAARIKDYPCLATGQTVAAAGIAMREKIGARMDIVSIEIAMADTRQIRQHLIDPSRNDPRTREAADHSYQFIFGAGLIDGDLGLAQFEKQLWNDPRMRDVMSRVKLSCDPAINSLAPDGFPCRVRARMMTGEVVEVIVKHPPGYSAQGLDEAAVIAKFERLASPHVARDRRARVVETCLRARNLASIGEMMSLLGA